MKFMNPELYHFTNQIEKLKGIIQSRCFLPSYCLERTDYFKKASIEQLPLFKNLTNSELAFPMVCFADLLDSEISKHSEKHGNFAMVMNKNWAMKNHMSPVMYTYPKSLTSDGILVAAINQFGNYVNKHGSTPNDNTEALRNIISFLMCYYKAYEGYSYDKEKRKFKDEPEIFYYEREWRFVPIYLTGCTMCLTKEEYEQEESRKASISKITSNSKNCLYFKWDDIIYVFAPEPYEDEITEELSKSFCITKSSARFKIKNN